MEKSLPNFLSNLITFCVCVPFPQNNVKRPLYFVTLGET